MAVTKDELKWREWVLGRERFKGKGPRSEPRPNFHFGGPGQTPIPRLWWARLEKWIANSSDYSEPGRKGPDKPAPITPAVVGQITPHFHVREFACHDGRHVPAIAVPALKRLCRDYLEPMRAQFGPCTILSGYRPRDYNAKIGGAKFSQHIYELTPDSVAADSLYRLGNPRSWAAFAIQLGAGGVGRYDDSGFVHIDNRPGEARWTG